MSEKPQSIQPVVKFTTYKTPKYIWFRSHLFVPLLIIGGFITIYLSAMVNHLALIGFGVIMTLFFIRPSSEIYHMRHLSLQERVFLILREIGQLILVFGGIILIFIVTLITASIVPGVLLLFLFFILMNRLETKRIAKQAAFWNRSPSGRN